MVIIDLYRCSIYAMIVTSLLQNRSVKMNRLLLRGDIDVNCYFIENNGECYIVDPGYQKERIAEFIEKQGWKVVGILLTHAHLDHIGALDVFDVPVYLHREETKLLYDDNINGFQLFGKQRNYDVNTIRVQTIDEHTKISLNGKQISVMYTPGHTCGGVCYRFENDLYSGDTLFCGSVGRWDFETGDMQQLRNSVVMMLETLPDELNVHPGHGESTTIGYEKAHNQFYLSWK